MAHTVMVTGADGFIGSHLTEELVKRGEKVRAFCLYNSFGSLGWIDTLPPEIRSEIDIFMGDVRDPNGVRTAMQGQERVFHLAALIAIPFSYHSPDSYVDTNIKGTLNVLQAARDLGTQRLMVTSTSEVYGTAQYVPIDEKHPYQGQSPYSATKIGADRLAESFYRSFDVPLSIVRPFNTYGPRQSARAVIPTIITQLLAGRTEIRLGSLAPTRDFNYVKDTAAGFMAIADCDAAVGQEINIATGREISIGDLADELIRQINPEARVVCEAERLRPGKSEVERLLGDASKLRALTGWQPAYTFEQGLAQTIEWLRGNMDGYCNISTKYYKSAASRTQRAGGEWSIYGGTYKKMQTALDKARHPLALRIFLCAAVRRGAGILLACGVLVGRGHARLCRSDDTHHLRRLFRRVSSGVSGRAFPQTEPGSENRCAGFSGRALFRVCQPAHAGSGRDDAFPAGLCRGQRTVPVR